MPKAQADTTTGLIGHWTFDGNTQDSSGQGNHGMAQGGPTFVAGKIGQALNLDGADDYVNTPLIMASALSNFTISIWTYSRNGTGNFDGKFIFGADGGGVDRFYLRHQNSSNPATDLILGLSSWSETHTNAITLNEWHHYVVVLEGTTGYFYKDGALFDSQTSIAVNLPNKILRIGAGENVSLDLFDGLLDDVRVYSRALSSTDVQELYNQATPTPSPTVSLSASPANITAGNSSTLTWSSTNATSCTASNGWSGTKATSGSQSVSPTVTTTYTLSCTGAGGTANHSTTVSVASATDTTPPSTPTLSTPTAVSSSQINLSWTAATDNESSIQNYKLSWCSGSTTCTPSTVITLGNTTSYAHTGRPASTIHRYQVSAVNSAGLEGGKSAIQTATTQSGGGTTGDCSASNIRCVPQEYATIQACANVAQPGDTCWVSDGTYNETVTVPTDGTSGNPITFLGISQPVVTGGFVITARDYLVIDNFTLNDVIYCNLFSPSNRCSFIKIRNNLFSSLPSRGVRIFGDDILVENNVFDDVIGDPINQHGSRWVVRNNSVIAETDINDVHLDFWQSFCSSSATDSAQFTLLENNEFIDISGSNVHFSIINGTVGCGMPAVSHIYRYNKIRDIGSLGIYIDNNQAASGNTRNVIYNNTFMDLANGSPSSPYCCQLNASTNSTAINNILYNATGLSNVIGFNWGTGGSQANNLYYDPGGTLTFSGLASSEPGAVKNQNPLMVNPQNNDFSLASNSPARDAGGPLTRVAVADSGSGTTLVVNKAEFFQPGWAGTEADWIAVGTAGNAVQISTINYGTNTLTLANPINRHGGDPVWLFKDSDGTQVLHGSAPDIGAVEFVSGGGTPAPTVSFSANPSTITSDNSSTLTWSSTNATSCTASGGWTGTKALSGSQTVSPTQTTTYTLSCTGDGGTTNQSTTVTVATPPANGSLAWSGTLTNHSNNFDPTRLPASLWDGDTTTEEGSTGAGNIASFFLDFDFGQTYHLTSSRLFGDAAGTWFCSTWTLQYKQNQSDTYTTAFSNQPCQGNQWYEQPLANLPARYVRVTVNGNQTASATQARELEIYGTLTAPTATFQQADRIQTNTSGSTVNIRSCASTSCSITGTQPDRALGTITSTTPTTADGLTWHNIDFASSTDGFVAESFLVFAGDLNRDKTVNSLDWSSMNSVWFQNNATADINKDTIVNSIDFGILNKNWARSSA